MGYAFREGGSVQKYTKNINKVKLKIRNKIIKTSQGLFQASLKLKTLLVIILVTIGY